MSVWASSPDGLRLRVRLTPRGGRNRIDGVAKDGDGRSVLKVRVAAAPVGGAANTALIVLLAKKLRLPKSRLSIVSGQTNRVKIVLAAGLDDAEKADLQKLFPEPTP